jgi:hypothetical protein
MQSHLSVVDKLVEKGSGSLLFKRDLSRAYRQIPIDMGDACLVGYAWNGHTFFDKVLSMGLRSAAQVCQRLTNAIAFIYRSLVLKIPFWWKAQLLSVQIPLSHMTKITLLIPRKLYEQTTVFQLLQSHLNNL